MGLYIRGGVVSLDEGPDWERLRLRDFCGGPDVDVEPEPARCGRTAGRRRLNADDGAALVAGVTKREMTGALRGGFSARGLHLKRVARLI